MAGPKQLKSQYVYSSKRKPKEDRSIVLQNKQTNLKQKNQAISCIKLLKQNPINDSAQKNFEHTIQATYKKQSEVHEMLVQHTRFSPLTQLR